jgi:hypothetical protein
MLFPAIPLTFKTIISPSTQAPAHQSVRFFSSCGFISGILAAALAGALHH